VAWNLVQYVLVERAGGFLRSGPVLDDPGDVEILVASGQSPWGHGTFPWMGLILIGLTVLSARVVARLTKETR
jgi:hypothetical protein